MMLYRKTILTDLDPEQRRGVHLCGDMSTCFAPVTDELLSRVEWEATINYDSAIGAFILCEGLLEDKIAAAIDAAVKEDKT